MRHRPKKQSSPTPKRNRRQQVIDDLALALALLDRASNRLGRCEESRQIDRAFALVDLTLARIEDGRART